jgi:hypothetical protein
MILIVAIPLQTLAQDSNQLPQNDSSTMAETSYWGENFSLTAGLKVWQVTNSLKTYGGDEIDTTSIMFGPAVNLTIFEKFYTGLSYYWGSGFDYTIISTNEYTGEDITTKYKGTKIDLDLWAGYSFHPRGSVFLGYKTINYEQDGDTNGGSIVAKQDIIYSGPVVGITGNYPIMNTGFILFGTFGYAFLDVEIKIKIEGYDEYGQLQSESRDSTEEYRGPAIELGASYIFKNLPQLSLSGGYKYQYYENVDDGDINMSFYGLTFGVNYRF